MKRNRLKLNTETLRRLDPGHLSAAAGGATTTQGVSANPNRCNAGTRICDTTACTTTNVTAQCTFGTDSPVASCNMCGPTLTSPV